MDILNKISSGEREHVNELDITSSKPRITLQKLVSVDGGKTYLDANIPPYPILNSPNKPIYKFIVRNTGNVKLTQIRLVDTAFNLIVTGKTLEPGRFFEEFETGDFEEGINCNKATVTGKYVWSGKSKEVKAEDSACYLGKEVHRPAIRVLKELSPDGGANWFDANDPPGPSISKGTNPKFRYTVKNTGDVDLTNIKIMDDKLGTIGSIIPNLKPGKSTSPLVVTGTWALGPHVNTATVTCQENVTDSDMAHYLGIKEPIVDSCPATAYVPATVSAPITITPYINLLDPTVYCCGEPKIRPGTNPPPGERGGVIRFNISQDICIKLPVDCGARTSIGDTYVNAGDIVLDDVCSECESNNLKKKLK